MPADPGGCDRKGVYGSADYRAARISVINTLNETDSKEDIPIVLRSGTQFFLPRYGFSFRPVSFALHQLRNVISE